MAVDLGPAARRWQHDLAAWAIPDAITATATRSPWEMPTDVFARRADRNVAAPSGVSYELAAEALSRPGSVLDVGAGAGAASLPLARFATAIIAVDSSQSMVDAVRERAERHGVEVRTILGRWPDVAALTPTADVVVCHHVCYNAPDLGDFVVALDRHARRRVVIELPEVHPMKALNPLWLRLHGLRRPERPTVDDAVAVLREVGIRPHIQRWPRPPRLEYRSFDDLVALTGQRLCLPPERTDELADALLDLGVDPAHPRDLMPGPDNLATLWWDVA